MRLTETTEEAADAVTETADSATTTSPMTTAERGSFSLAGISRKLGSVFGTTSTVLAGVDDEASAQKALPQLESASATLAEVAASYADVPEGAKAPLNGVITKGIARLKPLVDTKLTKEGVGSILTPVVAPMLETLEGLVK